MPLTDIVFHPVTCGQLEVRGNTGVLADMVTKPQNARSYKVYALARGMSSLKDVMTSSRKIFERPGAAVTGATDLAY